MMPIYKQMANGVFIRGGLSVFAAAENIDGGELACLEVVGAYTVCIRTAVSDIYVRKWRRQRPTRNMMVENNTRENPWRE
jgi:hypothetical protein